jgi:hypothetical protein
MAMDAWIKREGRQSDPGNIEGCAVMGKRQT